MDWQEISGNWVLIPRHPIGIVHFRCLCSGSTAAHLPLVIRTAGCSGLCAAVATPFVNTLEHAAIAQSVLQSFESAIAQLHATAVLRKRFPSTDWDTGLQTHLLIGSLFQVERAGNILISFNNYAAREAIPLQQFTPAFAVEFTLPLETINLVRER